MVRRILLGTLVLSVSCGSLGVPSDGDQVLLVSVASSLSSVFSDLKEGFEDLHDVDVVLNTGSSTTLAAQILEGAPVDVYASADSTNMDRLVAAEAVVSSWVMAYNRLVIAVPEGNPRRVSGLTDLSRPDLLVGLCSPSVPCGDLARQVLASAGVAASVDTNEPDVRSLVTKIEAGELDAGIVYVTEVAASRGVEGIVIVNEHNVRVSYPIAVLADAPLPDVAAEFVSYVLSKEGRAILERHGFEVGP